MREPPGASRTALSSRLASARLSASRSPATHKPRRQTADDHEPPERGERVELVTDLRCDLCKVDLARARPGRLQPRDGKQVTQDARHAVGRAQRYVRVAAQVVPRSVLLGERNVEVRADHGEGVAKLVRGFGDVAALQGECRLESREQAVDRVRETLELVLGALEREPLRQSRRLDPPHGGRHLVERAEEPPGNQPGDAEAEDEQHSERTQRDVADRPQRPGGRRTFEVDRVRHDERVGTEEPAVLARHEAGPRKIVQALLVLERGRDGEVERADHEPREHDERPGRQEGDAEPDRPQRRRYP